MDIRDTTDDKDGSVKDKFIIEENLYDDYESTESSKTCQEAPAKELNVVPHEKNWKGIIISIVVITIICAIVGISAHFLQPDELTTSYQYKYDFDALFSQEWMPRSIDGKWSGEYLLYQDQYQNFVQRNGLTEKIMISNETMMELAVSEAFLSPDMKYALLKYNIRKVYRHSTLSEYSIYTIATGSHTPLHERPLQYAAWGSTGSQMTYVLDSDIYYKSDATVDPVAVTSSGANSDGRIANGVADWLYEEEMFSSTEAHWVSDDGYYLAYVCFNDTLVPQVDIIVYSRPYTTIDAVNYPKAGFRNPTVNVYIYNLDTKSSIMLQIPESLATKDPILNSFLWINGNESLITWSNRYQNFSVVAHCVVPTNFQDDEQGLECTTVQEQEAAGWIENIGRKPSIGPGQSFFRIEEKKQGGNGNFHHVRHIDYSTDPPTKRFVTSGNWEVTKILGYSSSEDKLYFISTKTSPMERHLYSVNISEPVSTVECVTCGGNCTYVEASISSVSNWVLLNCKGPGVPYTSLLRRENEIVLESNQYMRDRVENSKMPVVSYETVTIAGELGTYDFSVQLYVPPGLEDKQRVPVLLYVYGGPGSQVVSTQFRLDWMTYLVVEKGFAVVMFDGRGSGFRGSNAMKEVSRRLGTFEVEDQITALREALKRHSNLDKNKVAVWGWSYGGYASMSIATHSDALYDNLVKCVISVAPVTDWQLYDSIYTERYMGSPMNNYDRYQDSSLLNKARYFENFQLLLVHGTKDDNVHFQNSAELEKELVYYGFVHRYQVYTDEAHSLSNDGIFTQMHLYRMMTQFLVDCYGKT